METKETLTPQEIEQLCRAYLSCRLSLLQEKELELVLLCSDLDSPIVREVRRQMSLTTLMADTHPAVKHMKKTKPRLFRYTGTAASIGVAAVCSMCLFLTFHTTDMVSDVYVCSDGKVLTGHLAQTVAMNTEEETMNMFKAILEDVQHEQRLTEQYMNSVIK